MDLKCVPNGTGSSAMFSACTQISQCSTCNKTLNRQKHGFSTEQAQVRGVLFNKHATEKIISPVKKNPKINCLQMGLQTHQWRDRPTKTETLKQTRQLIKNEFSNQQAQVAKLYDSFKNCAQISQFHR